MLHAFIMDPLASVKSWKDTTWHLMKACQERGHKVAYLDQQWLWLDHDKLRGKVQWLEVIDDHDKPFRILDEEDLAMESMDTVWLRTDPPFDRRYFYTTLLLDYLPASTRVLNQPQGVRDWNEKLAALEFPYFTPATIVSSSSAEIAAFAGKLGKITVKPIDGHGGKGIVFFEDGDDTGVLDHATHQDTRWVIAQEFLSAAADGDKRILLLNGDPLGAILRVHAEGVELNNLDQGGKAIPATLDQQDRDICEALKPALVEKGMFFVGIDVIGGNLIEVNVTSPTGLQEMSTFDKQDYHHQIIAALE